MIFNICPYCNGIAIMTNKCKEDLHSKQEGIVQCLSCNKYFILYYKDKKIKTKELINNDSCYSMC